MCEPPLLRMFLCSISPPHPKWLIIFFKHAGVRSLFNRHYVKTGKVPKNLARTYNDLFERRQESDYMDFISFEASQVRRWIPQAEAFVEHIFLMAQKKTK